uniref:flagellar export protein FliJ n=1 Tax=Ningiella ruwaisensis TaxID=2364274 RepID=UPI0010A0B123|nr:flagellar export protein FliJ [Ningiella ruwaisensis]
MPASIKQLSLVAQLEKEKEQKLSEQYQQARQHLFQNQQKLSSLEQYRLDYLKLIREKASQGLGAKTLIQHQSFVGKLDKACEQQVQVINQAVLVADQRKNQWLKQQTKAKAIEKLINKQQQNLRLQQNRQEQKLFDELSSLAFSKR